MFDETFLNKSYLPKLVGLNTEKGIESLSFVRLIISIFFFKAKSKSSSLSNASTEKSSIEKTPIFLILLIILVHSSRLVPPQK